MKISQIWLFIGLAIAVSGCHQRSADAVPAGSFRLVVKDTVKDEVFRMASLTVSSSQPGTLSLAQAGSHCACRLLIPAGQTLREGQMLFMASKATDSRTTNAYILASLQVKVEGGDEGMLIQSSAQTGLGSPTYYPPKDTRLDVFCNLTAKDGVYPLDVPLEIGRVDGKPMMLTVGKPML